MQVVWKTRFFSCFSIYAFMEIWITNDIVVFIISLILAGIIIPQILLISFRKKLFDDIDDRKVHNGIVPRLGGIAFLPSILFSCALVIGFSLRYGEAVFSYNFAENFLPFFFMIGAVLLMFLVGISDDLLGVRYVTKFIVQIISAIIIVFSGVYIINFFGFLWIRAIPDWIGWIVTGFMVIYIVNSINLIDGIDGLASGLSTIAFVFYAIIFYYSGQYLYSLLSASAAGTLLPFFYYNVFGETNKQKKIFMGDTGALTTGMILAFCGIAVLYIGDSPELDVYNPVILGFSPLIIPCFDSVRVYLWRVARHKNPFLPDKSHIHHKLLAMGFSQRSALVIILLGSMFFIVMNLLICPYINPTFIIIIDICVWSIANFVISRSILSREKRGLKTF